MEYTTFTDLDQATRHSQDHDETSQLAVEDMGRAVEEAAELAAAVGWECVVSHEDDWSIDVYAFAPGPYLWSEDAWAIKIVANDSAIRALRQQVAADGDESVAEVCDVALEGHRWAREKCGALIRTSLAD